MQNRNQMSEQGIEDIRLELTQEVDDHHLGNIKFAVDVAYNDRHRGRQPEKAVSPSTCNGVTKLMDKVPYSLYPFVQALPDPTDPKIRIQNPSHSIKVCFRHQTAWAWAEPIITNRRQ